MDCIIEVSGLLKDLVDNKGGKKEEKQKKNGANKKKEKQPMPAHLYYRKIYYPMLKDKLGDNKKLINEMINDNWKQLTEEQKNRWKVKAA